MESGLRQLEAKCRDRVPGNSSSAGITAMGMTFLTAQSYLCLLVEGGGEEANARVPWG